MATFSETIRGMFWGFHAVMTKEWIEILNDKFTVAIILIIPIIQMTIYGFGVSFEVRQVPTVIFDQDLRPQSSILLDEMLATDFYKITKHVYSRDAAVNEIVSGNARAAIIIPPNFSDKLQEGTPAQVQVLIDGSDSTIANALATTAIAVGQSRSLQILSTVLNQKQAKPPIDIRSRMLFNPDAKTTNFILPGLIGFMAQTITLFLTVNSIVRERVSGTLEQLMLTPVKPLGLMLGKLVPNGVIGFIGTNLMLAAMYLIFKVPINGNIFLLEGCILIFVFVSLSIGILISSTATSQEQAMHLASFVLIPSVLLSGFIFPRESMPALLNWLGFFIPLTYFLQIQRGIILRGAGLEDLWQWVLPLMVFGFLLIYLSVKRFRKSLG
ncbi:MAG: ABC transporter permease [Cyanobacteria bacterium SZAS-4]|nr:ABC transporter permease [Cyanobacteria bacterium SZAS-4]